MLLTVFEVFIGVHGLALIRVRFLFLLLCPPPCPGGCLCTTELCMGVFCGSWCYDSFYWGPCSNMASNILLSLVVSLSFIWFPAFVSLYMRKLSKVFSIPPFPVMWMTFIISSMLPMAYYCTDPSRKSHSTTFHKTPPYRAQLCIGIHPGREEDTTKETGSGPESTPARGPQ